MIFSETETIEYLATTSQMEIMNFDEFWDILSEYLRQPKEFKTLDMGKPFKAIMIDSQTVIATPESSGKPRPVNKDHFRRMWNLMKDDARSERYVSKDGRYAWCYNPVYICALIDYKVGDQKMQ